MARRTGTRRGRGTRAPARPVFWLSGNDGNESVYHFHDSGTPSIATTLVSGSSLTTGINQNVFTHMRTRGTMGLIPFPFSGATAAAANTILDWACALYYCSDELTFPADVLQLPNLEIERDHPEFYWFRCASILLSYEESDGGMTICPDHNCMLYDVESKAMRRIEQSSRVQLIFHSQMSVRSGTINTAGLGITFDGRHLVKV